MSRFPIWQTHFLYAGLYGEQDCKKEARENRESRYGWTEPHRDSGDGEGGVITWMDRAPRGQCGWRKGGQDNEDGEGESEHEWQSPTGTIRMEKEGSGHGWTVPPTHKINFKRYKYFLHSISVLVHACPCLSPLKEALSEQISTGALPDSAPPILVELNVLSCIVCLYTYLPCCGVSWIVLLGVDPLQ